eukprot:scaffold11468_cov90-Isochrysis_galbana.AAC.1
MAHDSLGAAGGAEAYEKQGEGAEGKAAAGGLQCGLAHNSFSALLGAEGRAGVQGHVRQRRGVQVAGQRVEHPRPRRQGEHPVAPPQR